MTTGSSPDVPIVDAPALADFDCGSGRRWYAVHTQAHREFRAERQLINQGFRVFLPLRLKRVRHARKLSSVAAPFFPGYLFVELDLAQQRWRSVNGTFGVAALVMQGDLPLPVPRGVIETMRDSLDHKGLLCLPPNVEVGTQVQLAAGPFAERLGTLDRLDDCGRVVVLLEIMGAAVPVRLGRELLLPAA